MARPPKPSLTAITGGRGGGSGPEDPMLEQRVARLESDMSEMKASLKAIEVAVADIKHLPKMADYLSLQKDFGAVRADVGEMKGRMSNLPTTWTVIAFATGAIIASAGLAFTIARLIKP